MGFRKAQDQAAGGFEVPAVATPPGSQEPVESYIAPAPDHDQRYVEHRAPVHSDRSQVNDLERELGLDRPPPAPEKPSKESKPLWETVVNGLKDMPFQVPAGALNYFNELGNGLISVAKWAENSALGTHHIQGGLEALGAGEPVHGVGQMVFGEPETLAGQMTSGISQFLTGFLPASRAMKGLSIFQNAKGGLNLVGGMTAGGLTDFVGFDPHQQRLANLVQEYPSLSNPITAYLASDPKDSEAEGRFKNTIEGMGLGLVVEGLIGAVKYMRGSKGLSAAETHTKPGGPAEPPAPPAPAVATVPNVEAVSQPAAAAKAPVAAVEPTAQEIDKAARQAEFDSLQNMEPDVREKYFQQFKDPDSARKAYDAEASAQSQRITDEAIARGKPPAGELTLYHGSNGPLEGELRNGTYATLDPEMAHGFGLDRTAATRGDPHLYEIVTDSSNVSGSGTDLQVIDASKAKVRLVGTGSALDTSALPRNGGELGNAAPAAAKIAPSIVERFEGPGDLVGTAVPKTAAEIEAAGQTVLSNAGSLPDAGKAVNINLNKIDGSTDLKAVIAQIGEAFNLDMVNAKRGVVTDAQVAKLAEDLGMTAGDLAKRLRGQALNAEEITAARLLLNASAEDLATKARAAAAPGAGDVEKAAFLNALEAHKAIQMQVTGATAEAGRALRALRQVVGVPGEAERAKMLKQMVSLFEAGPEGQNVAKLADAISKLGSVKDIASFTEKSFSRKLFDAVMEVRVNNLLSGARTFTTNLVSNTYMMFGKVGETYLAEGLGAFKKGSAMNADRVAQGEAAGLLSGIVDGFWDGYRLVRQSIKDRTPVDGLTQVPVSKVPALSAQNFNLTGVFGQAVDYLGMMTRLPGHGLNMTDAFFKAMNYRMEINRQSVREAAYRGLEGAEKLKFIEDFRANPPDEFKFRAQEEARVNTFTNLRPDTGLLSEQTIRAIQGTAFGRIALPFLRTSFNMIEYTMQRNPFLYRFSPQMVDDLAAGGARADAARAKIAFGTTLMLTAGSLAASGRVTGGGPANPDAKKALESTGWRPYSLKVDNKFYTYNRVEPIGTILGMAADWAEIGGHVKMESSDVADMAFAAAVTAAHIGPAENLVESMTDLGDLFTQPDATAKKWVSSNVASSLVPNAIRQLMREGGDTKFDTSAGDYKLAKGRARYVPDDSIFRETLNKIKASIPGFAAGLPAQHNMFGEVITYDPGWGPDIASPVYVSEEKDSPIRKEIARLTLAGYKFDLPGDKIVLPMGAVPLNAEQHQRFIELSAGVGLKDPSLKRSLEDELNYQVKNNFPMVAAAPKYKQLDENKYLMIQKVIQGYRNSAEKQLGSDMEPVGADLVQKYTELGRVKFENVTGKPAPVTITSPGGGKVR